MRIRFSDWRKKIEASGTEFPAEVWEFTKWALCPVHLIGQNYFCPGQNENCPGQNHFCPGQKILSEAKKSFFIQFITNDELFIHVQNFLFRTKNILSETILILSRTKTILSGQMDWALDP